MTDWRQHMHSLPSGERPLRTFAQWFLLAPLLMIAGMVVFLMGGAILGMSFGIGPEDTGGTIWAVFGLFPAFIIGALIVYVANTLRCSRASCRAAFYSFTLPAWVFVFSLVWQVAEHFFCK